MIRKNDSKRHIHYVLSSHWDREWHQTFQDFRWKLVKLLDSVLEGWEQGTLQGPFQTDGQAIMLEDYLEVRPEQRKKVENYAQKGKFIIGPWYVLPDEFLVSGESLIRNIRLGRQVARELGAKPSNAGFVCDLFGHISQLPQILSGFGISGGFLWRGLNCPDTRNIIWTGADGTELPCYKFGRNGYCDYAFDVRHASEGDLAFDHERANKDLENYITKELELTKLTPLLIFDGGDHQGWDRDMYNALLNYFNKHADEIEGIHSSLDDYLADMLPEADKIEDRVTGELREPGKLSSNKDEQVLIPGVLSSRVKIKQANAECQTLLCSWAEPLSAIATITAGQPDVTGFLNVAWKWLLKNHPHDSICGCSIDAVHEDMKFRFAQCKQITERISIESESAIAASIGPIKENELRVTIFNPLPYSLNEYTDIQLQIPVEWPVFSEFFGFEDKPSFRIYNSEGKEIPYQRVGQDMNRRNTRLPAIKFPQEYKTNDVNITLPLNLRPLGHTTITVRPGKNKEPTRYPTKPCIAINDHTLENEKLRVTVQANGTIKLKDKINGQIYERLLTLEDRADIGDGWFHGIAVNDEIYTSHAVHSDIALISNGSHVAAIKVSVHLRLPEDFKFDTMRRSERKTDLTVEHVLRLRAGSNHLEVETTVHNTVRDHRLCVLFPTDITATTYLADSAFDVIERPIKLRADNHVYRELETETKPQQSWTTVFDAHRGLAVISTGLLETAVRDIPEHPMALTLLRSTQKTVSTDGEPNGQIQGQLKFKYWIKPFKGEANRIELFNLGQALAAGTHNVQLTARDIPLYNVSNTIPAHTGFLEIHGNAVLTSLRKVKDNIEVRIFNPNTKTEQVSLEFDKQTEIIQNTQYVQQVNFESSPLEEPQPVQDGIFTTKLKPKEIITLRFSRDITL